MDLFPVFFVVLMFSTPGSKHCSSLYLPEVPVVTAIFQFGSYKKSKTRLAADAASGT